jgi:hypothetical protein
MIFVLCAFFAALFFAGCPHLVSPPDEPVTGSHVLVVQIEDGAAASRTALPSLSIASYNISVSRLGVSLGGLSGVSGSSFPVPLSNAPVAGDMVFVEGFDSGNVKRAQGSHTLTADDLSGTGVTIILSLLTGGTGDVDLIVRFEPGSGAGEITSAELSLYGSLADYQAGNVSVFTRYRKDSSYGAGENFEPGPGIPIRFTNLPSGNYVVKIDFFRSATRVSRLVQTIIVRAGLTTNRWDNGGSTLVWDVTKFASSNANLSGISIGGVPVTNFSSTTYSYAENIPAAPSDKVLSVTSGTPGQTITASLNGAPPVSLTGGSLTLTGMKAANSIAIIVTAPDGVTKQTYAVGYTYHYGIDWYVDGTNNPSTYHFPTVTQALDDLTHGVKAVYNNGGPGWPGGSSNPVAARINISGTITEAVDINGSGLPGLPPILLMGSDQNTDKITAAGLSSRPLTIKNGATVILGDGLTLTEGTVEGGGVYLVSGSNNRFIMNGGSISGNTATGGLNGGGVYVAGGSFTMNGGSISGNTATAGNGGGVSVAGGSFTMSGGTVSGNTASGTGGGVYYSSSNNFIMNGGSISGNTSNNTGSTGGGVYFTGGGAFTMNGGSISENTAPNGSGGGVFFTGGSSFEMNEGSISGNTSNGTGGGVFFTGNGGFTMNGGSISGNTVPNGSGGGVYYAGSGSFTMDGGSISGNTAAGNGGGVFFYSSNFIMNSGTISGNTASVNGGGVYVNTGSFTMAGDARVDTGNPVFLVTGMVITPSGSLTANPAANIESTGGSGTQVLGGSDIATGDNYKKFQLNGVSNEAGDKIGTDGKIQ